MRLVHQLAIADAVSFDPTLITAGGPDNGWLPTPIDRTQIAYGVDSRVQNLLTIADTTNRRGLDALAAMQAHADGKFKTTIIRPSYSAGPGDVTDRFTYWPFRVSKGGEMLAPGPPSRARTGAPWTR